ncbi:MULTISPECIES: hypothetical protein [unclassified Herbaspirillum]|uniref:hypothetical protein n=1 Tax=unclassified Herbaspirillum TaxID=2624150 RepID=UPI00114EEABB|nr:MULTISPECIES: hypothetical protein [unclassified Herbaspirillum]MBB5393044.1 hypothetical protein [Herbaspirillum sp. SJZ102]TQK04313.1 hypothetical protein FB599_2865 [Herbaspirillum sp. SJZ130]TQK09902.1 hypothetical protein FB598_2897 [Herbaspirillum sp. SJZ106]
MRHPKPQKGNPHKLTIDQHIFPKACISRFTDGQGTVQVRRINGDQDLWLTPSNSYFCARRLWDQKAEAMFMKSIEDRFQNIAKKIVAGAIVTLDTEMNAAVTDMYLLWTLRHERFVSPLPDVKLSMVQPERELSVDTQEILEANGYIFALPDNTIPSRFMTGVRFVIDMDRERQRMAGKTWGIVKSTEAEFLVPDNFSAYSILPLSPMITLMEGHPDQHIDFKLVADINGQAVHGCHHYYFARNIKCCPILKHVALNGMFDG